MNIEGRRVNRLRVMKAIFDLSGGSERQEVRGPQLTAEVGLSDQDLGDACDYLAGEGLIEVAMPDMSASPVPYWVNITHLGIVEMEQSLEDPNEPTQHFPPAVSIINIHGSVIGSAIQSGSPGAQQEVTIGVLNLDTVRDFLQEFDRLATDLDLPVPEGEELDAEIATVRAQVESPKPKKQIIRSSLATIQTILEGAAGNLAATGLLDMLQHIHF